MEKKQVYTTPQQMQSENQVNNHQVYSQQKSNLKIPCKSKFFLKLSQIQQIDSDNEFTQLQQQLTSWIQIKEKEQRPNYIRKDSQGHVIGLNGNHRIHINDDAQVYIYQKESILLPIEVLENQKIQEIQNAEFEGNQMTDKEEEIQEMRKSYQQYLSEKNSVGHHFVQSVSKKKQINKTNCSCIIQ